MPNWCVGTLKVRGEKQNMVRFLKEAFEPISHLPHFLGGVTPEKVIEENEYDLSITADKHAGFHLKGTRRNFIEAQSIEWCFDDSILLLEGFRAAWGIDVAGLTNLSKEYELDLRIYAFERGMEFNEDFEVHKGEVIRYQEIKFDDYRWECVNPDLGG